MDTSPRHRVLIPLISSSCDEVVVEHALRTYPSAELTVLGMITPLDEPFSEGRVLEISDERRQSERTHVASVVDRSRSEVENFDGSVSIQIKEGMPADATVEFVDNHRIEHVVLPESPLPTFVRRVAGSPQTSILRRISVPVTVVDC